MCNYVERKCCLCLGTSQVEEIIEEKKCQKKQSFDVIENWKEKFHKKLESWCESNLTNNFTVFSVSIQVLNN